jgi:hypothetical protein
MKAIWTTTAMLAGLALAGCDKPTPPGVAGVCYQVLTPKGAPVQFKPIADHIKAIEYCGAKLEVIRIGFLRMGGSRHELTGAYGDQFLFLDAEGVSVSSALDGVRYQLMTRTSDGRLVRPGYNNTVPAGP